MLASVTASWLHANCVLGSTCFIWNADNYFVGAKEKRINMINRV